MTEYHHWAHPFGPMILRAEGAEVTGIAWDKGEAVPPEALEYETDPDAIGALMEMAWGSAQPRSFPAMERLPE